MKVYGHSEHACGHCRHELVSLQKLGRHEEVWLNPNVPNAVAALLKDLMDAAIAYRGGSAFQSRDGFRLQQDEILVALKRLVEAP